MLRLDREMLLRRGRGAAEAEISLKAFSLGQQVRLQSRYFGVGQDDRGLVKDAARARAKLGSSKVHQPGRKRIS